MKKILIIEDDFHLESLMKTHLRDLGCEVTGIRDVSKVFEACLSIDFDLIVLDTMLPGMDGIEVCKRIKAKNTSTPVLILSSKSEESDKVSGLESGADDYLTKPFGIRELIARIKVILRRTDNNRVNNSDNQISLFSYGNLEIDIDKKRVRIEGRRVDLSPREYDILVLLACNPGKSYNRKRLLNLIWGYEFEGFEHTINSHINRLRRKIESDSSKPRYILTSWGIGYRFNEDL